MRIKRGIALLLSVLSLFSFVSCKNKTEISNSSADKAKNPDTTSGVLYASDTEAQDNSDSQVAANSDANTSVTDNPDTNNTSKNPADNSGSNKTPSNKVNSPNPSVQKPSGNTNNNNSDKPAVTSEVNKPDTNDMYEDLTYEGKTYRVKMGRNGQQALIADRNTLPPQLRPYCYPYDLDGIRLDMNEYAKTKGFKYFGNVQQGMTDAIANEYCSWDPHGGFGYLGDKEIVEGYENKDTGFYQQRYSEVDEVINIRENRFKAKVDDLASGNKKGLAFWFVPEQWNDVAKYNGKNVTSYRLTTFYGWMEDTPFLIEMTE